MTANTSSQALDDLVRATNLFREQYLHAITTLQDGLVAHQPDTVESRARNSVSVPESHGALTPPLRASTGLTCATENSLSTPFRRARAATFESTKERPSFSAEHRLYMDSPSGSHCASFPHNEDVPFLPLLPATITATARAVEEYPLNVVRGHLHRHHWVDGQLLNFLHDTKFSPEMTSLLDEAMKRRSDIPTALSFRDFADYEREQYSQSTFEVYEINHGCKLVKLNADADGDGDGDDQLDVKYTGNGPCDSSADNVDAPTVWETIRTANPSGQSVGRITIVQEPTPLILAALQLTMSPHFDMPELLTHLLSDEPNRGRTHAFMTRAYERPPSHITSNLPVTTPPSPMPLPVGSSMSPTPTTANVRQRSFFFVFKYYTVVDPPLEPAPWQRFDKRPSESRMGDHIDIAECGSVLALSLGGEPQKAPVMKPRRERAREGLLFETFGPWQLLVIQSFPDNSHTVRGKEFEKKCVNGPYAFLDLLISEYRDATKRNLILHERVTKLITPPPEFMFDPKLRDKLLFEDKYFTYIRRYFWAYNTLAVVNTGIKSMIAAYVDTFTDSFWAGTHPTLWPHTAPESPDGIAYRDHMANLRREFDKVIQELTEVLKRNERTRKEIENLRDQLFSGSSIKESRRAIEQGDNIRILTMISMIFLPLTFVTSVFGMTVFTIPATDWRFALTMVLVCVPFMLLITLLQTRSFGRLLRKLGAIGNIPVRLFTRLRSRSRDINDVPDSRSIAAARLKRGSGACPMRRMIWPWGEKVTPRVEMDDLGQV